MARIIENIDVLPADLQESLRRAVALFDDMDSRLEKFGNEKPSNSVYHYTNDAGLYGMIKSGELHLTDIANLNDPKENNEYLNAHTVFANMYNKTPQHTHLFEKFSQFGYNKVAYALVHRFVSCFSDHADDLSQWRAYGDNGRGYMLGFDGQELLSAFEKDPDPDFSNLACYIKYDGLNSMHEEIAARVDEEISFANSTNSSEEPINMYLDMLFIQTWATVMAISLMFKDEAYRSEKEYRLLNVNKTMVGNKPAVQYKMRPYELVRYKSFKWRVGNASVLKSVMIGPAANTQKSQAFVESCLREFHNDAAPKVVLEYSKVPYRA